MTASKGQQAARPGDVEVKAAHAAYRAGGGETALYDLVGSLIASARHRLGDEAAFSVVLSRVTRELRRTVGTEGAKAALRGLADTMDEAARYDDVTTPKGGAGG